MELQETTSEDLIGLRVEELTSGNTYEIVAEDGFYVGLENIRTDDSFRKWVSVMMLGQKYQLEGTDLSSTSDEVQKIFE
jgi:hypothetical protein